MTWTTALDVVAAICMLSGALFALIAALGVLRLPDLLSRMHAATKPQVLGLLLVLTGLGLHVREPELIGILVLIGFFQMITSPVATHMVGRAAFRARLVDTEGLVVDELSQLDNGEEPRGAP
ncbi:monovalent cation/H(+) antiporter subunit G [Nocardioides sp. BGMRC 2183]|nr:monovalent cation/H(+) antiporter subunit G [Nocardioides sp. BGMRC 2183]